MRRFHGFATSDLVADGRIELIFCRGAFTDNFPLPGYDLKDCYALFDEKIGLFAALNARECASRHGRFRPALRATDIALRPVQPQLPVWNGCGSTVGIARAARLGYRAAIPVPGGSFRGMHNWHCIIAI